MEGRKPSKKQRKALAFRERKGKLRAQQTQLDLPEEDIPDEQLPGSASGSASGEAVSVKRKQSNSDEPGIPAKRRKRGEPEDHVKPIKGKTRYVLFVGNLLYTTTKESIQAHFEAVCPDIITIRLLTPKETVGAGEPNKSKGFAFVEFSSSQSLQRALNLHHSQLDGRKINVELTAGGGGSGEKRRNTLKVRNEGLEEERKEMRTKRSHANATIDEGTSKTPPSAASELGGPSLPPSTQSLPVDRKKVEHSGRTSSKKNSRRVDWASGANATPIG